MLVASAVLPMPGRPARMTRSDCCNPPMRPSRSVRPVARPERLAPRAEGRAAMSTPRGRAGARPAARMGWGRHVDRGGERLGEALEAGIVASGFGDFVELALGLLD